MSGWNKALWLALFSFAIAAMLFGWSFMILSNENEEAANNVAELPPPGRTASLSFRPANSWKRYGLVAYVSVTPIKADAIAVYPDIPCDFAVRFERDGQVEGSEKFRFWDGRSAPLGSTAKYRSDVLDFAPETHDVIVRNLGCDAGYQFTGGALQMQRFSTATTLFSRALLPFLAALVFCAVGLISLVFGGVRHVMRRRSEAQLQNSLIQAN